jgi:hypothetical protein
MEAEATVSPTPTDSSPTEEPLQFEFCSDEQREAIESPPGTPLLLIGGMNSGKDCALDTPLPTPTGWKRMGDIEDGDTLFNERGHPCRVLKAHQVEVPKRMFRIHFSGGTHIDAGGEHLWTAWDFKARKALRNFPGVFPDDWPNWRPNIGGRGKKGANVNGGPRTVNTEELFDSQVHASQSNWAIPNALPLSLPETALEVDPYTLGVWLGDGTSSDGTYTGVEPLIEGSVVVLRDKRSRAVRYRVPGLREQLDRAGLIKNKHVPTAYLRASAPQRLALLQGLMDTDGTSDKNGTSTFTNTNRQLVDAVYELMISLGLNPTISEGRATLYGNDCGPVWDVYVAAPQNWPMFRLIKKQRRLSHSRNARRRRFKYVRSIEEIKPRPARCLTVDSPNALYLVGKAMVPTHNTTAAILYMLALCEAFPGFKVAVLRKTFADLRDTVRPSFDEWIPEHARVESSEKRVVLKNGSSFVFHHLDRPDFATILKGLEINGAILDQAEQMQEPTVKILLGRLGRWKGAKVPLWTVEKYKQETGLEWPWKNRSKQNIPPTAAMLTANPSEDGDPELHWLWQRFSPESKAWQLIWSKKGFRQLVLPTASNKFASQQNIDYLLSQDEDYIKRYYYGQWVRSKGHIFRLDPLSELDYDDGLMAQIQNSMKLGRALDHGDTAPTCCLWYACDENNNVFIFQEYYQPGMTDAGEFGVEEHRKAITQLSKGMTIRTNLADPSIFDKTRGISGYNKRARRWSVATEYSDTKLMDGSTKLYWQDADNNEMLSRTRLKQYLKIDPKHRHPITGELGAPHIYFIKQSPYWEFGCVHALSEIRTAKREVKGEVDGRQIFGDNRDESIPDHALDCVRYIVNSRPLPASLPSESPKLKAYAKPDGRVVVTVPPVTHKSAYTRRNNVERGSWKSRGGGYLLLVGSLLSFLLRMV